MSEALDFLVKVRPEAMAAYFKFLKHAGSRLDPKTRDLISVITKVHAQTERGLRQYVTRALRDGCTPDEIIDALLMAFPALGLTKITWAVDVILSMKLPGFDTMAGPAPAWHDVGALADFPDGKAVRRETDGRGVFLYRDGAEVVAYDSICPHKATDIPELALDGLRLTCPKHQWVFDIRSGACIENGDSPLRRFETRVAAGRVLVRR